MYPTSTPPSNLQSMGGPGTTRFWAKKKLIIGIAAAIVVAGVAWATGSMVLGSTNRAPAPTTPPESSVKPPAVLAKVEAPSSGSAENTPPQSGADSASNNATTISTAAGNPAKADAKPNDPSTPGAPAHSATKSRFPGDPNPSVSGKLFWGAAINGNGDPKTRHEQQAGASLSLRRTFFQWRHHETANGYLFKTVENDIANNRLSWVSTKTPSWRDVANGKHDARIDHLLKRLESYNRPIWLTFHHEPEGGGGNNFPDDPGGAAAWRGMQIRVRERMNALGIDNVAFAPILMSWTWDPSSKRSPSDWYVPGIWDFYGIDHYQNSESGTMLSGRGFNNFMKWIANKNLPVGIGEWGNRGTNSTAANEMQAFLAWGLKNDVVGMAYFDSGLNSPSGSWELKGQPLSQFRSILASSKTMRVSNLR